MTVSPASTLIVNQYQRAYQALQKAHGTIEEYIENALSVQATTARMDGITRLQTDGILSIRPKEYTIGLKKSAEAYIRRIELTLLIDITERTIALLNVDPSSAIHPCLRTFLDTAGTPVVNTLEVEKGRLLKIETTTFNALQQLSDRLKMVRKMASLEKPSPTYEHSSELLSSFREHYDQLLSPLITRIELINLVFKDSLSRAELFFGKIRAANRTDKPSTVEHTREYETYLSLVAEKKLLIQYAEYAIPYCSIDFSKWLKSNASESFPVFFKQMEEVSKKLRARVENLTQGITELKAQGQALEAILDWDKGNIETYLKKPLETDPEWFEVSEENLASRYFKE